MPGMQQRTQIVAQSCMCPRSHASCVPPCRSSSTLVKHCDVHAVHRTLRLPWQCLRGGCAPPPTAWICGGTMPSSGRCMVGPQRTCAGELSCLISARSCMHLGHHYSYCGCYILTSCCLLCHLLLHLVHPTHSCCTHPPCFSSLPCSIFDRGVAYCGSDYLGHTLWDKFLQFEEEQGTAANVAATYTRVLSQPLRELPRYMQR